ncbi:MAG: hypothetical protein OXG26_02220, partial [Caldilineaceae bacterium]|nr:hypothetical protein [Caldilineaceae bacterium]
IRSQVLPGLQFRRSDLLNLPDLEELALDELYAGYVITGYRDAVDRAEAETAARRQAEERAEEAEERAAGEAAARRQAEERVAGEAAARRQAEERAEEAEEQMQALKAEIARLRQDRG